ncbi:PstA family ABC transporter permease [Spongorhabdus nitratireducens]
MIKTIGQISVWLLIGLVVWMGVDMAVRGASGFHFGYLFEAPADMGRSGGIATILVSTALIVTLAVVLAVLFSLPAAIIYTEFQRDTRFWRLMHIILDIGVGAPRIVWGLFGGVLFVGYFNLGFSILSGIITLACLLAPILVTGFIVGLQATDPALRKQCVALGLTRWSTLWNQVLPAARPSLIATAVLATGRGCGDAAALLFTAGVATTLPTSLYDSGATLAVFVFHLLTVIPGGQTAAYTAAAVLFVIMLAIQWMITAANGKGRFAH